ncbi:2Fe-2S iron-sulfur cluster-binding protein [Sphingomonas sp. 35-24ZXX]|jgi:ferredoxin, 2Fe-2S|uniref:2Fe-2S iron-sulfur cluster-binding protein n=1 Tax=Sphingomonas sp. 35-24ZXX TaxID=1545915 RepID=UPI00053BEACB|nr:2Fe-2S iron-sulfur cluster-binding protein [Sphingomonas sp. 35-24ZXX]
MKIIITDQHGEQHEILDANEGETLMQIASARGIAGILADCGGACSCATCHVYIDPDWSDRAGPPNDVEEAMLDMVADVLQPTSRLSCQVRMTRELDGIVLRVAPN